MRIWPVIASACAPILFASAATGQTASRDNPTAPSHIRFYLIQSGGGLGYDLEENVVFYSAGPGLSGPWSIERSRTETDCLERRGPENPCPKRNLDESIDGRTCPALQKIMSRLGQIRKLEQGSAHPLVTDTPLMSLVAVKGGLIATDRLAEYRGPLVDWWQSAQEQLKPCWKVRGRG